MKYELSIREHNVQPHLDIESDLALKKDGLFTFILRVNNGNIVDYVVLEHADARKYLVLKQIVIEEHTIARDYRVGGNTDALRPNNIQRANQERSGADSNDKRDEEQKKEV